MKDLLKSKKVVFLLLLALAFYFGKRWYTNYSMGHQVYKDPFGGMEITIEGLSTNHSIVIHDRRAGILNVGTITNVAFRDFQKNLQGEMVVTNNTSLLTNAFDITLEPGFMRRYQFKLIDSANTNSYGGGGLRRF